MPHRSRSPLAFIATALPLLWIGVVIGVSFLATPAKFMAGPLDGALALSISVVTFAWLHVTEAIFAAATVLVLIGLKAGVTRWLLLAVAVIALALGADWVLPAFEGRTGLIPMLPLLDSKQLHMAFAVLEGSKILALFALAYLGFRGSEPAER